MGAETKRQDFANRTLDAFWSDYKRPEINERITERMHALGFSAAVLETVFNPDTYVVHNLSDGNFTSMTYGTKPLIGVVALKNNESVRIALDTHPLQTTKYPYTIETLNYPPDGRALAFVLTSENRYRTSSGRYATHRRRPVFALKYSEQDEHARPSAVLHEFTHLAQVLDRSTRHFKNPRFNHSERLVDAYNDEFQAYDVQYSVYGDDPGATDDRLMETARRVALFRSSLSNASRMLDLDTLNQAVDSSLLNGILAPAAEE